MRNGGRMEGRTEGRRDGETEGRRDGGTEGRRDGGTEGRRGALSSCQGCWLGYGSVRRGDASEGGDDFGMAGGGLGFKTGLKVEVTRSGQMPANWADPDSGIQ